MANQVPLINGTRHSWASVEMNILGRVVTGITAFSYKKTQNKTNIYGAGDEVVARGRGNKEYEGSITLLKYEADAIRDALPKGKELTDIAPFPIVASYITEGDTMRTDVVRFCEFIEENTDVKQGDTSIEEVFPLIVGKVSKNV
ncbi:MAG: hypothetical protein EP346_06990 [Bacteroidetes bacterium]|nr:MAG: hypothetical protein EP346_06990 [Bacteroidota bacterium]